jgi:hypothetical protein
MAKQVLQILLVSGFILLLSHCAQIVPLGGGKRDTVPPKLTEAEPANKTLNFNSGEIVLHFDEFIQLKDLSSQLIVSPSLKTAPEITADGKKLNIGFKKEELKPNTTYRFYFGRAVADMNESNSIQNFEYVFSTGNFIDTLKTTGNVSDGFTNRSAPDILIGLYMGESVTDSLPYKNEPDYIARSNENGEFSFKNLPKGTFKAFGFSDKNKNKLYDGETEKIAFLGTDLKLISDTTISLKLFQEESSKSFIKGVASPYFGLVRIILNKKSKIRLSALNPQNDLNISESLIGKEKDTVLVYYKNITDSLGLIFKNITASKTDTLKINLPKNNPAKKRLKTYTLNIPGNKLGLYDKLKLSFLNWMDTSRFDLSKLKLSSIEDSLVSLTPLNGRWLDITSFELDTKLKEGVNYTLRIDTNAFFDVNRFTNDSSTQKFKTQSKVDFGKVTLKMLLPKKQNYVVQLINDQNVVIKERALFFSLSSSSSASIDFVDVPPGVYNVKVVFDDNENQKWDTGNLMRKQQPEKVILNSKQLKVLSDWEFEEEILIKE